MKKKKTILCILSFLILGSLTFIVVKHWGSNQLYDKYRYPNEEVYGKELYSEIGYKCSDYESEIGHLILDKAIEVAEYTGTEQDAEQELGDVGALNKYYYFDSKDAVIQEVSFEFITCKISGNEGHVWVASTVLRHDKNGKTTSGGGRDMLTLWYIEKVEDDWCVVKVIATP